MDIFPISLKLKQQLCLIVGGGKIAYRKAQLLAKAGAKIDIVAPDIDLELATLVSQTGGQLFQQ
ncbi:MAG: siroheme synthase, partial [Acinetobacter sp.]